MPKYLETHYDHSEVFNREVRPLIEAAWDLCMKHKIPFFVAAAVRNNDERVEFESSQCFPGPEVVPVELVVASQAIQKGLDGAKMAIRLAPLFIAAGGVEPLVAKLEEVCNRVAAAAADRDSGDEHPTTH